jgi:hypothetical protein
MRPRISYRQGPWSLPVYPSVLTSIDRGREQIPMKYQCFYKIVQYHTTQDRHLHSHYHENLIPGLGYVWFTSVKSNSNRTEVFTIILNSAQWFSYHCVSCCYNFGNFLYIKAVTEFLHKDEQALVPQTLLKCDTHTHTHTQKTKAILNMLRKLTARNNRTCSVSYYINITICSVLYCCINVIFINKMAQKVVKCIIILKL